MMHRARLILAGDPHPNDPEFFERVMAAVDATRHLNILFDFDSEEIDADGTHSLLWAERDELSTISLVKDMHTSLCVVTVTVPKAADLRKISEVLGEHLEFVSLPEMVESVRASIVREPEMLLKIATVAGPRADPDLVNIFVKALDHRLPGVRYYAAYAAARTLWPVFIPELERLLKLEPDEDVREMAEHALEGCQQEVRRGE